MPVVPLDVNDSVLYDVRKVYLSKTTSVTIQDHLDFWGTVFFNGQPIANIGSIPMASQAQAEAGVDNTTVMSPLRTKQAIDAQVVPTNILRNTVFDAKGDIIVGVADNNSIRLPVGTDGQILSADAASTGGLKWIVAPSGGGGTGVTDGDKGDIVVSGSGSVWMLDSTVVTAAAKTVLDDTTVAAMLATLGGLPTANGHLTGPLYTDGATISGGTGNLLLDGAGSQVRLQTNGITRVLIDGVSFTVNVTDSYFVNVSASGDAIITGSVIATGTLSQINGLDVSGKKITSVATPTAATNAANKSYVDGLTALFTTTVKGTVPPPGTSTGLFLKDDGTWAAPAGGGGVTDGDKGDIVVSGSGTSWLFDSTVVTAAAKTLLDDASTAAMLTTLGAQAADPDLTTLIARWTTAITTAGDNLQFFEGTNNGTNKVTLRAAASLSTDPIVTLPTSTGTLATLNDLSLLIGSVIVQQINAQTGTTYTLTVNDASYIVTLNNASAITVTVPTNATAAFVVGSSIDLIQLGAGQVTVAPAGGVTINKAMPTLKSRAQYSVMTLIKIATDTWVLTGDAALS